MKHGDLSNALPQRILVVADVFLQIDVTVKKKFKVIPVVSNDWKFKREVLSRLYLVTGNRGITLELVSFSMTDEDLNLVMDRLSELGTNPFRYSTSYASITDLVNELPYRPEVIGVLDRPDRLLRYGHWGLDFTSL